MDVQVRAVRPNFVAEIRGVNIARPIAPRTMAELWTALVVWANG
jgi:hypothetical protein